MMRTFLKVILADISSSRHRRHPAAIAVFSAVAAWGAPAVAQSVPPNPAPTCTVTAPSFATWFQSGSPSLNGVVNPANSVTFPNGGNCDFYQWSEQMLLWMTSPTPLNYGGGSGRIFDSATFYDVSPADASGNRTFIAHTPGVPRTFFVRAAQVGPHGLPIVFSRSGKLMEIQPAGLGPTGRVAAATQIRDLAGKLVSVEHARIEQGKAVLLDKAGQRIKFGTLATPRPAPPTAGQKNQAPQTLTVRKLIIDNIPVFVDPANNVIDTEEGQAGGGDVLMAQGGTKLIYYVTLANDVFAYFATGVKDHAITPGVRFPTTQADLTQIVTFAAAHGRTLADPTALAIEAKSSWIEASGLADLSSYITMTATIPTYNTSSTTSWVPTGQRTVQLAMLGLHVVGSAAGHPEMIWATFEHAGNTPNAAYSYVDSTSHTTAVAQSTEGTWLFTGTGAIAPFNQAHMTYVSPNIEAATAFTISPSNTIRWKPWGAASDTPPNPLDASAAASNSEIISINNSVRGQLVNGDVRSNYVMIGSTWTIGGAAPSGSFSQLPTTGNEVGTSLLANSTMETYQQGISTTSASGANCLKCHNGVTGSQPPSNTTLVSHVFAALQPLFP